MAEIVNLNLRLNEMGKCQCRQVGQCTDHIIFLLTTNCMYEVFILNQTGGRTITVELL